MLMTRVGRYSRVWKTVPEYRRDWATVPWSRTRGRSRCVPQLANPRLSSHRGSATGDLVRVQPVSRIPRVDDTLLSRTTYSHAKEFISYDSPNIAIAKAQYINRNNLGGAMFWSLEMDRRPGEEQEMPALIPLMSRQMEGGLLHGENQLAYSFSSE
jgi:hypothetical protein